MTREAPAPAVVYLEDVPLQQVDGSGATYRVIIDGRRTGCRNLIQRVFYYPAGTSAEMRNPDSEDVLYVVSGEGSARIGEREFQLEPDTGALVPEGIPYSLRNPGPEPLEIVSVLSPQPGHASKMPAADARPGESLTVHASDEKVLPASRERRFKLMIDPRRGARYVTQFIGMIDQSKADFHHHTYEEVIYILDGEGICHVDGGDFPLRPASCVYLPPGSRHCLENPNKPVIRLLGVFSPAGSPANSY